MNRRGFMGWATAGFAALFGLKVKAGTVRKPVSAHIAVAERLDPFRDRLMVVSSRSRKPVRGAGRVDLLASAPEPLGREDAKAVRRALLAPYRHPVHVVEGGAVCRMRARSVDIGLFDGTVRFSADLEDWT